MVSSEQSAQGPEFVQPPFNFFQTLRNSLIFIPFRTDLVPVRAFAEDLLLRGVGPHLRLHTVHLFLAVAYGLEPVVPATASLLVVVHLKGSVKPLYR